MGSTYVDSQQKSTRISYWTYDCTGNILYFQFTLYVYCRYSDPDSKEPTTTYVQPEPMCQPSGHVTAIISMYNDCYTITLLSLMYLYCYVVTAIISIIVVTLLRCYINV